MFRNSRQIISLGALAGIAGLLLVAPLAGMAEAPLVGGGNPPMPPSADSLTSVGRTFVNPGAILTSPGAGRVTNYEAPLVGGGNPPMPGITVFDEGPLVGGGNPPMPPSATANDEGPLVGGGNPPMPPSASAYDEGPLVGGGNPPMPPSATADDEGPLVGGGNPPMPPSATADEAPLVGGGSPPMPPSCAVVSIVGTIAVYADGTLGYPNGDFQFTSGAYLWADGFVRYSSAPGDFVWTNYAGVIINTTLGDVAANGLAHVEFATLIGIEL